LALSDREHAAAFVPCGQDCEGTAPSRLVARFNQLIVLPDSRRNRLFAPLAFLLLWEIRPAFFVEQRRMAFDYPPRPGIVRKSNALELMRSIGLEV